MRQPKGDYPIAREEGLYGKTIRAIATGEYREPKKGEWYLSGAIAEAYQAKNDLSHKYWIAKKVRIELQPCITAILPD